MKNKLKKVVIGVPVHFNSLQKDKIFKAGKKQDLKILN